MASNGWLYRASSCQKKRTADEAIGANPTDRERSGSKIHLHVDKDGLPMGVHVVGANVHDSRLVGVTFASAFSNFKNHGLATDDGLCLDKAYDFSQVRLEVMKNGLVEHIRSRGEEVAEKRYPARRWVVERTFAWLKDFRTIRTRYCQRLANYLGFILFACALVLFRKLTPYKAINMPDVLYVQTVQARQGLYVACPEEIA